MTSGCIQVLRQGQGEGGPRLLCLPFAGGSAWSLVPLARSAPSEWWVGAFQRAPADPPPSLDELAAEVAAQLQATLSKPGLLLGHSFGAVVAYRAAQIAGAGWPQTAVLVLSAPPPLRRVAENAARLVSLPAAGLLGELRRLRLVDGLRHDDDVLERLVVPAFRTDLTILATYHHDPEPLPVPPVVLAGTRDSSTPPSEVYALARELGAQALRQIDGDHLYVMSRPADVLTTLAAFVRRDETTALSHTGARSST